MDGFWAFELERRGARVTALDLDDPAALDWPPRLRRAGEARAAEGADLAEGSGFEVAHRALGSAVERRTMSVYEATPEALGGPFDLVFCGSVLIHLRDPMLALERMAGLCRGRLVLAEEYSRKLGWVPRLKVAEFRGESPWMTWWRPSSRTWLAMVRCAGFEDVRVHSRFGLRFRDQRGAAPTPSSTPAATRSGAAARGGRRQPTLVPHAGARAGPGHPGLVRPAAHRRAHALAGRRRPALPRRRDLRRLPGLRAGASRRGRGGGHGHRRRGGMGLVPRAARRRPARAGRAHGAGEGPRLSRRR